MAPGGVSEPPSGRVTNQRQ